MSSQHNNVGLTHKQIQDAMRGIREAISGEEMPDTDILELTEKIEDNESGESELLNTLNKMLKDNNQNSGNSDKKNTNKQYSSDSKSLTNETRHSVLENLVIEALKPQLTQWLNANLPDIVRSIVEKEIQKLVP